MALITDQGIAMPEELRRHESGVYEVASAEGIDLAEKLALGQEEIRVELMGLLFAAAPDQIERVVVTPPLRLWLLYHTLGLVYRDAYGSHLNERYLKKKLEYEALAGWAKRRLLSTGVGMTGTPIPKAGKPSVAEVPSEAGGGSYWVRAAWVGSNGEEGCPSDAVSLTTDSGKGPRVRVGTAPACATGWNVYVGRSAEECRLQNGVPLALDASWSEPETGLSEGPIAGDGQKPQWYRRFERRLPRG
ncbi:MAG: hypothetical protein ACUVXB_16180 [Bryobacteraceae bacterium]